ncbi:unnamed protein product [Rhizophagus irregularis]|nr:unnamed protein product [Rhizophagus irregularis]
MILPFILQSCLHSGDIKNEYLTITKERLNLIHKDDVIKKLIKTWAFVAKASKKVFSKTISRLQGYDDLSQALDDEQRSLLEMFPADFESLPNLHINRHLVDHARNYGTCVNMAVGTKEMIIMIVQVLQI